MIRNVTITVSAAEEGERLDRLICRAFPATRRSFVREALAAGDILCNRRPAAKGARVRAGDIVWIHQLLEIGDPWAELESAVPLRVLAETPAWVAVEKPCGIPVQPLHVGERGTLAGVLAARFPECLRVGETHTGMGGIVHRLDTATSGVLLVARTDTAWRSLRQQFRRHQVCKRYIAIVEGRVVAAGCIRKPLAHDPRRRGRMIVAEDREAPGADRLYPAETAYAPVAFGPRRTWLEVTMHSGVTHQIRAHLAFAGFPIVGDTLYGRAHVDPPERLALHAAEIAFADPDTGAPCRVVSPAPSEFDTLLAAP